MQTRALSWLGFALTLGSSGCGNKHAEPAKPETSATPLPATSTAQTSSPALPSAWPVPTGVSLAILPGKGVGPIRLGATVATIERLMERDCEVKTETLCGYNGRAVDFELADGKAVRIHVQRTFRKNPNLPGATYGTFNGGFTNGVRLEMLKPAVADSFGAPERVEVVHDGGPWGTVERATYPGMVLEYDRLDSGDEVLGGVVIVAGAKPAK